MNNEQALGKICQKLNLLLGIQSVDLYGLKVENDKIVAQFGEWHLESRFFPVIELKSLKQKAVEARLIIKGPHQRLIDEQIIFAVESNPKRIILLDRMIRALHTSNFAIQYEAGPFSLDLQGKHMESLDELHGVFQHQLMDYWSLPAELLTLKIVHHNTCSPERLQKAIDNYRQRGYRLGLKLDKPGVKDCLHMWTFGPDQIQLPDRFSSRMLVEEPLKKGFRALVQACHEVTNTLTLADVHNEVQRKIAFDAGVDWVMS